MATIPKNLTMADIVQASHSGLLRRYGQLEPDPRRQEAGRKAGATRRLNAIRTCTAVATANPNPTRLQTVWLQKMTRLAETHGPLTAATLTAYEAGE
jgi:hypothetical protein